MTYNPTNPNGQATSANSSPVVVASDQSAVPVSGTVSITANSSVNLSQVAGTTTDVNSGSKSAGTQRVVIATDQPQLTNALKVDGSAVTQPVSGTIGVTGVATATNQTGGGQKTQIVDGSGNVIGATSNALNVNISSGGSSGTQYADGATRGTATGTLAMGDDGTNIQSVKTDSSGVLAVQDNGGSITVDGSVTANAGTNLNTSALALESGGNLASIKTDVDNLNLAQGSTTSGQKGNLGLGAVTTGAPTYTTAQSSPLSLTTAGGLRVDGSAVTQPVSASSLPLPTGAGTAANQATMITSLSTIASNTGTSTPSVASTNNSTTATLGSGATFTGTSDDCINYSEARVTVFANVASATDGLSIQQSSDGTNWDITDAYTIPAMSAGQGKTFVVPRQARYVRIVYTNGGTGQTTFRLQTILNRTGTSPSSQRPGDAYSNETDLTQQQSFLMGFNGTTWDRLRTTGTGVLTTSTVLTTGAAAIGSLAAGSAIIGKVGIDQTTVGTTNAVSLAQIGANTVLTGNGTAGTGAQRVTIASDNTAFTVNAAQSGTWTVQPGNTPNTTPWLAKVSDGTNAAAIKAASTAVAAGDPSLAVGLSPNSPVPAGTNAIGSVNLAPTATGGWSVSSQLALTNTVATVSGAAGKFGGYMFINLNSTPAYIQVFDTTGTPTLGTGAAFVIPIPANGTAANGVGANLEMTIGIGITSGIKIAATTTANGSTTVATALTGFVLYK